MHFQVLEKDKNLFLLIVGEERRKKKFAEIYYSKKLNNNIFLAGHIKNVYPLIKNS